jgi:hypothetical protein
LSFRSAAVSREESVASLLTASRFLADRAGFGMTKWGFLSFLPYLCESMKIRG